MHGRGLLHHFLGCLQQLGGLRRRVGGGCGRGRCRLGGWRLCRGCGLRLSWGLLCCRLGGLSRRFLLGGRLLLRWCFFSGRLLSRSLFGGRVLGWRLLCILGLGVGGSKRLPMLCRLGHRCAALLGAVLADRCDLLRDDSLLGAELGQLRLLTRDLQVVPQSVDLLVEVLLDRTHLLLGLQVYLVALELLGEALFALDLVLELLDLRADLIVLRLDGLALALDGRLGLLGESQAVLEVLRGLHFQLRVRLGRRPLRLVLLRLWLLFILRRHVIFKVNGTLRGLNLDDWCLLGFGFGYASEAQQLIVHHLGLSGKGHQWL